MFWPTYPSAAPPFEKQRLSTVTISAGEIVLKMPSFSGTSGGVFFRPGLQILYVLHADQPGRPNLLADDWANDRDFIRRFLLRIIEKHGRAVDLIVVLC